MKKIKGLLLFGILTLLGIGSSFAHFVEFQYFDLSNRYSNFLFESNGYGGITFSSANGGSFSPLDNIFYTGVNNLTALAYLNNSNYSLSSPLSSSFSTTSSRKHFRLYLDGNNIAFRFFNVNYSPYFNYLLNISNSLTSTNYLLEDTSFFVRTLTNQGDGIIFDNPFSQSISPSGNRSWIFIKTGVYDTNFGQYIQDTEYSGVIYNRGTISPGVFSEYSFAITPSMSYNSGSNILSVDYDSIPYLLRTVSPGTSNSNWTSYRNVYILKLDSFYKKTNTGDFSILALSLSGDNYIYSEYTCPSNSVSFGYCSFVDGGYVGQSNLSNSFTSWKNSSFSVRPSSTLNLFNDLSFYLFTPNHISFDATYSDISYYTTNTIYSIRSNNIVFLYRSYGLQGSNGTTANWSSGVLERSFGLISSDGINILEEYLNQGGGNQSTGSEPIFDYNVAAIDYLITCYITSGDVCVFPSFNREDFESTFSVGGSVWNGYSGYLLGDNAYLFLKEYCINSNIIDYPFCSQLDLYSGAIIIINYENGSITYDIFSDSFMVSIGDSGSGQIGNVSCLGAGCSSVNSGNPEYIHNFNSSSEFFYYSGDFLDIGYYDNFFNLNLTGYFLKCPWSYVNNRRVFGENLIKTFGGYDILLPLNCFIAAYNHGKSFNFLERIDLGNPIMGEPTTKEHKLLYGFFDLIMSFGLLLFLRVVFKLFK